MRKLTQPMIDLLSYVLRNGVLPAVVNTSTLRGLGEARGNLLTFSDTDPHAVQLSVSGVNELLAAWSADDTDLLGTTRFDGVMMVMHADAQDIDTSRTRFAETLDLALVDAETEAYDERHLHAPVLAVGDTVSFERMNWTVFSVSATDGVYLASDDGHKIWVPLASAWKLTKVASPVAPAPVALVLSDAIRTALASTVGLVSSKANTIAALRKHGLVEPGNGFPALTAAGRQLAAANGIGDTDDVTLPVALAHPMDSDPFAGLPDNGTDPTGDTSAVETLLADMSPERAQKTREWIADRVEGRKPWPLVPEPQDDGPIIVDPTSEALSTRPYTDPKRPLGAHNLELSAWSNAPQDDGPTGIDIWHEAAIAHVQTARRASVGVGESERVAETVLPTDIPTTVLPVHPFPQDAAKWPQDAADEPETDAPVWRAEFHPGRTSALYREIYDAVYAMRVKEACTAWLGRHHSGVCETCGRSIMTHTAHVDAALKFVAVCPTAASLSNIDPDELVRAAQQALERPSDVGYFGDRALWSVWGVVGTQGPDPDTLEASNWRVMLSDLQGRAVHDDGDQSDDPAEYVDTETFSHWAFGYVTHMVVRVLVDTDGPLEASNLTYTFVRAVELAQSLQDYPVLDESDYSELESEGQDAAWDEHLWSSVEDELTKALTLDDFSQATLNLTATLPYSDTTVAELVKSTAPQDIVREFYYGHGSTMWREEGSSFYNEQHDEVMADMLSGLFVHDHVMCWSCEDSVEVLDNGTLARHTTLDIEASRAATPIGSRKLTHIRKHCHASGTNARPDHYHVMSFVEGYLPDGDIFCTTKASEARDAFLADLADTRDSLECLAEGWIDGGCPDASPCDHCQAHEDIAAMLADFKKYPPNPAKGDVRVTYNDGRRLDIVHKIEHVPASDCQV